jgi:hypothetical protein
MKKAGDILSTLFDERFVKKAQRYSKLFDSWKDITEKNGIAAAAVHSQIKELDRGVLLIETEHPGWKQILQTKQSKLLNDFRIRFPELDISGISLMLGRSEPQTGEKTENIQEKEAAKQAAGEKPSLPEKTDDREPAVKGYNAIKDEDFLRTLKKLEQRITDRESQFI